MIALAASLLVALQPVADPAIPDEVQIYYDCAANRADAEASSEAARSRRADEIVATAISSCARLRAAALEATQAILAADTRVQDWVRTENIAEAEARRIGEAEFDRALRRQLLRNIGADPDAAGEAPDAKN